MAGDATLKVESLRDELLALQAELSTGAVAIRSILESSDPIAQYLYVVKALENVPGIGKVRARAILGDLGVGEHTHCGDLDGQLREAIVSAVEHGA